METKSVARRVARAGWDYFMDSVAVSMSTLLRGSIYLGNKYADPDRLSALLEKTRMRHLRSHEGNPMAIDEMGLMPDDCFVVDARRADEYQQSHMYSSINCHYADLEDKIEEIFARYGVRKAQFIVAYCAVGLRSGWVTKKLRSKGYTNAAVLYGGYYHWGSRTYEVLPQHLAASLLLPAAMIAKPGEKIEAKQDEKRKRRKSKKEGKADQSFVREEDCSKIAADKREGLGCLWLKR